MTYVPTYDITDAAPITIDTILKFLIALGSLAILIIAIMVIVWIFKRK